MLLGDERIAVLRDMLWFINSRQWTTLLEAILTSINGRGFESVEVPVKVEEEDAPPLISELVSRDTADVVRFLIWHQPFEPSIHCEPLKLFGDGTCDTRVYNELNTGDWWWETQGKSPPGSVPILDCKDETRSSSYTTKLWRTY